MDSIDSNLVDLEKKIDDKLKAVREDMIRICVNSLEKIRETDGHTYLDQGMK